MKTFKEIPATKPITKLLDNINFPNDLKKLNKHELVNLADELREFLLFSVGQSGGHLGAGLGVIELTIVLHYIFNTPKDKIIWDVGHQAYPHKILTGRKNQIETIRKKGGLAPFPTMQESDYDAFGVGHSSTSIGAALGMAALNNETKTVAVIGDGAMTAGMAFEALSHAGHIKPNMLIILNDNDMSISENVGGLSNYFSRIWASKTYKGIRKGGKSFLKILPQAHHIARKVETQMKAMVSPGSIFEELGLNYIGPIDGHNINELHDVISNLKDFDGPQFLHIITKKGAGLDIAEEDRIGYHAIGKISTSKNQSNNAPKYQDIFSDWIVAKGHEEKDLIAITPAMREGSGLVEFSRAFPERYFDVAIAEQHAVTFAAGLACQGKKPLVAIYSTFLQRAYDQLIHDVALQNLDVTFAIDRAGLVGEDGPTHSGNYDLVYMRCIPNLVIAAPSDENETVLLLNTALSYEGPAAVRYPRGAGPNVEVVAKHEIVPIGKARVIKETNDNIVILNFGSLLAIAEELANEFNASLYDMRFVKPLDKDLLSSIVPKKQIITIEDGSLAGGAGSAVMEYYQEKHACYKIKSFGIPDTFIEHASRDEMIDMAGLSTNKLKKSIQDWLQS
ncbi:MAG: 1-deoxy-D-xylulose-5-phosphate synthase [Gammaproteobacteria bacterium]